MAGFQIHFRLSTHQLEYLVICYLVIYKISHKYDDTLASLGKIFACEKEENMLTSSNGVVNLGAVLEENLIS